MPKVAAVHINPKIQPYLNHNDRTNSNSHTITKELSHLNEYSDTSQNVRKKIDELYAQAQHNFYNYCLEKNGLSSSGKPKGLQNFTKKERCFHEAIYEISETTTMEECQALTEKIAELTGFKPLQVVIHRDEVFTDEKGEQNTHYHAHAVFFTLDENGLQLARQQASLNKANLSKMQTLASQCLDMERGARRFERGEAQPKYIQDYREYARVKEAEKRAKIDLAHREQENAHKTVLIQNEWKELAEKTKAENNRLNEWENAIKLEKKELERQRQEQRQEIERTNEQLFKDLELHYRKKKSFWKNLLSLCRYHKQLAQDYQAEKTRLIANTNNKNTTAELKLQTLEKKLNTARNEISDLEQKFQQEKESRLKAEKGYQSQTERIKDIREFSIKNQISSILERFFPQSLEKTIKRETEDYLQKHYSR